MVHSIIILAPNAEDRRAVELAEVEDYQRAVGGWIEALDVLSFGCTMFLNEDGLIRGLPHNRRTTYLWWYHLTHAQGQARSPRWRSSAIPYLRRVDLESASMRPSHPSLHCSGSLTSIGVRLNSRLSAETRGRIDARTSFDAEVNSVSRIRVLPVAG